MKYRGHCAAFIPAGTCMKPVCAELTLPPQGELVAAFAELVRQVESIARYLAAFEKGHFTHPDGRLDPLGGVTLEPAQAALISYLCRVCPSPLSLETGFGMGTSALIILGTRRFLRKPFEHFAFDPFGLDGGRGTVVESYLNAEFKNQFRRVRERSEIGVAKLVDQRGHNAAGLILIDGGHHFETVMTDFVLADLSCSEHGFIVFDDAAYPAVETLIDYVRRNRPNYALAHLPVPNTAVLQKRGPDLREWYAFTPFHVPQRRDWTPADPGSDSTIESALRSTS
jgi:hypothetical protein